MLLCIALFLEVGTNCPQNCGYWSKNEKYSVTVIALLYLFNKGLLQPEYFYYTQSSETKLIFQAT